MAIRCRRGGGFFFIRAMRCENVLAAGALFAGDLLFDFGPMMSVCKLYVSLVIGICLCVVVC